MKRHIIMLSAVILLAGTLSACTSTSKQECWRANNIKSAKDCNSGNSGVSIHKPGIKGNISKRTQAKEEIASPNPTTPEAPNTDQGGTNQNNPDQDNSPVNNGTTPPNNPDQDNNSGTFNQSNSNDISGYDPFGGLYGPGT